MNHHTNEVAQTNAQQTDILIAGAGMVGAAAALGFAQQGYRVMVAEPNLQTEFAPESDYELRISAVTSDNIELLKRLGAWRYIQAMRVHPFDQLSVRHHAGDWLTLGDRVTGHLGYMLENRVIQFGLLQAIRAQSAIEVVEAHVEQLDSMAGKARLSNGQQVEFVKVLGCDGAQSQVRQASGIGVVGKNYGHSCLLTIVQCQATLPARTWESFAKNGEIHALLPLANNQACLIMYGSRTQVAEWQQTPAHLQQCLAARFENEVGHFELLNYGSFPLSRQSALRYVQDRTILLGDAAHTIHPMAGQGVNLGFRDVKKLLDVTRKIRLTDDAQKSKTGLALRQFELVRRADNELMAQAMDSIGWVFQHQQGPVALLRNIVLTGMQRLRPAQRLLTAYASGVWKALPSGSQRRTS